MTDLTGTLRTVPLPWMPSALLQEDPDQRINSMAYSYGISVLPLFTERSANDVSHNCLYIALRSSTSNPKTTAFGS